MKRFTTNSILLLLLVAGACAGPRHIARAPVVPPLALEAPSVQVEQRVPASADRSPSVPDVPTLVGDEAAETVYRSFVRTVEVEVPVAAADAAAETDRGDYGAYDDYVTRRGYRRSRTQTAFPINTAVGAGIGAIIGNQSGRSEKGALIGAATGLMFDVGRWLR